MNLVYMDRSIDILVASRKESTYSRLYNNSWNMFHLCCPEQGLDSLTTRVGEVLTFFQDSLE